MDDPTRLTSNKEISDPNQTSESKKESAEMLQETQASELTGAFIKGIQALGHVIREGGLAGASRKMKLSEAAVSRLISGLEQSSGLDLFNRDRRSLVPTNEGIRFYSEAQRILDNLNRISSLADEIRRGQEEFLRIIVMPRLISGLAAPAITQLAKDHPRIHISIDSKARDDGDIWMNNQVYDVGLGSLPIFHPKIRTEELVRLPAYCLMQADHRLASKEAIEPIDIVAERLIMLSARSLPRIESEQWFRDASTQLCHSVEVNCPIMVLNLVAKGSGISLVDPLWLGDYRTQGLVIRPLVKPFYFSYGLMWYVPESQRKTSALTFAQVARDTALSLYSKVTLNI